jgi:streptogramin lyase
VIIGPDGAPWVTEGGQNAIAHVDPADHKVMLFRLPETAAVANLNTCTFDRKGILWFIGQSGFYGRLEIRNRAISLPSSRHAGQERTASRRRPMATSGTPRLQATISQRSISRTARQVS